MDLVETEEVRTQLHLAVNDGMMNGQNGVLEELRLKQETDFPLESDAMTDPLADFQSVLSSLKEETPDNEKEDVLSHLGVTVYDQSTLESGLIEQLETALEAEEERKRKEQEEKERKSKLLKKARKKKMGKSNEESEEEEPEAVVANTADVLEKVAEDEERVKLGEMTPFGTTLESVTRYESSEPSDYEEDLEGSGGSDPEFIPSEEPKPKKTRKARKRKSQESSDELGTDDSAWESSEDESKSKKKEKVKRKSGKAIDDGDLTMYKSRIAEWKESKKDDVSKGYEQFEGGLRVPSKIWKKLFRYQRVGVRWLWELYQQKCGGILGDEMGLGKTVQIISFLAAVAYSNLFDRSLGVRGLGSVIIVAPTTVMHQWVREFHTWWPPLRVAILHESGSHNGGRQTLIRAIANCKGVLVTSYTGIVQYKEELLKYDWHFVILDEGHKIRNPDNQATLVVKQFRTPYRIILSGSPIQNNLKELWSLFDFVFPGKLGTLPVFMQQFAVPITIGGYANASKVEVATAYKCACILRDTINPYLLRRQKADVKEHLSLPQKSEQVLFCKLTEEQRQLYRMYIEGREVSSILEGKAQAFLGLINLRKICNHPDLFPLYNGQFRDMSWDSETRDCDWKRSGKMIVVESLLKIWKKQGHRVLLFSQSKQMLDIFERFVRSYEYKYMRLDGSTSIGARQPLIDKFNSDPSIFLFLLTTRVGGLGVNLTGANRVIIYDPDWNPMTDVQARERSWRIGQRKDVTIFRLLTSGTIEEKIYHRQIFKQFLTNKVLKDPKQRRFFKSNDLFDLFTLQEADKEGTETGAIFAGTGSEILRGRKKKRRKVEQPEEEPVSKKKKKKAKVDGEVVENVEKKTAFKSSAPDEEQSRSEDLQNEYVLEKLFKKSGLQSALKHDKIMESSAPDYEIVEAEAEKVAKEAATWLKASRRECFSASAGIPTWTGSHGAKKPRFGRKQNTKLLGPESSSSSTVTVLKQEEKKKDEKQKKWDFNSVFGTENGTKKTKKKKHKKVDLKPSSSSANDEGKPLTSSEILARIRERNRLVGTADDKPEPEVNRPRFRRPEAEPEPEETVEVVPPLAEGDSNLELLRQIRNFLLFGASVIGQACTEELLTEFRDKLPEGSAALFRALLREICSFSKQDGKGVWQLLPEFR